MKFRLVTTALLLAVLAFLVIMHNASSPSTTQPAADPDGIQLSK